MDKISVESHLIRSAPVRETGWWAGAPSATYIPGYGFLLAYRMRAGDGRRGYENRLAFSDNGIQFEDIGVFPSLVLSTRSMECPCIRKWGDTYYLYLSYVDSVSDRWRIDVIKGKNPSKDPIMKNALTWRTG